GRSRGRILRAGGRPWLTNVQRSESLSLHDGFGAQAAYVCGDETGLKSASFERDVAAGALDAKAREPDAIDDLACKCTQIIGVALCIAHLSSIEHIRNLFQRGELSLGFGDVGLERRILLGSAAASELLNLGFRRLDQRRGR